MRLQKWQADKRRGSGEPNGETPPVYTARNARDGASLALQTSSYMLGIGEQTGL